MDQAPDREPLDAPEWPAAAALLPALAGADVVDLRCGAGGFVRYAAAQGAASVLGLDLAVAALDRARAASDEPRVHVEQADLEQVTLRFSSYDLAYGARVLHDLDDPLRFFRVVNAGLRPGGRLVLTFGHPGAGPGRHPFGTTLTALARAGLVLRELVEWAPPGPEHQRPVLVLLRADKPLPGTLPR